MTPRSRFVQKLLLTTLKGLTLLAGKRVLDGIDCDTMKAVATAAATAAAAAPGLLSDLLCGN